MTQNKDLVQPHNKEVIPVPASLQYLDALSPELITPLTFAGKTKGARIAIIDPNSDIIPLSIYRFVSRYRDGGYGIQDEIMFSGENVGSQLNFEFDENNKIIKYPQKNLSPLTMRAVEIIRRLSKVKGASIDATEGYRLVSDGNSWVEEGRKKTIKNTMIGANQAKELNSGNNS